MCYELDLDSAHSDLTYWLLLKPQQSYSAGISVIQRKDKVRWILCTFPLHPQQEWEERHQGAATGQIIKYMLIQEYINVAFGTSVCSSFGAIVHNSGIWPIIYRPVHYRNTFCSMLQGCRWAVTPLKLTEWHEWGQIQDSVCGEDKAKQVAPSVCLT